MPPPLRRALNAAGAQLRDALPETAAQVLSQLVAPARETGIADPVGEAIAAEAGEPHQLDVLRVVSMAQVTDQPPESGCGYRIVKRVESIRRIRIHCDYSLSCNEAVP